jgi:RNA polymerase sigma-70 factor (ECF subfamily)
MLQMPPPSFQDVFTACAPLVLRALRRLVGREEDVEDLAQEVFLVVHRQLPGFEGRSKVSTWVYGICVRVASDHRKRAHVRLELPTGETPDAGRPADQGDALSRVEARAALDRILATLDDDKRAVFVLFELEELPMAEVAAAVGVPLQTAYARLYAARRKVEEAVARAAAEAGGAGVGSNVVIRGGQP